MRQTMDNNLRKYNWSSCKQESAPGERNRSHIIPRSAVAVKYWLEQCVFKNHLKS